MHLQYAYGKMYLENVDFASFKATLTRSIQNTNVTMCFDSATAYFLPLVQCSHMDLFLIAMKYHLLHDSSYSISISTVIVALLP